MVALVAWVRDDGEVRVASLSTASLLIALAAGAAGSFVLGELAKRLHAALPYLDATLASYSLSPVGGKHAAHRKLVVWILVDLIYIGEYLYKDLWLTAALYAGLVALAIMGLRHGSRHRHHSDCSLNNVSQ